MGAAQLAEGNEKEAIELLQKTVSNVENPFYKDACWYMGLAHIKQGNYEKATQFINQSSNPGKEQLLNELKNKKWPERFLSFS